MVKYNTCSIDALVDLNNLLSDMNLTLIRNTAPYDVNKVSTHTAKDGEKLIQYHTEAGIFCIGDIDCEFSISTSKVIEVVFHGKELKLTYHQAVPISAKEITRHILLGHTNINIYSESFRKIVMVKVENLSSEKAFEYDYVNIQDPLKQPEEMQEAIQKIKGLYGPLCRF